MSQQIAIIDGNSLMHRAFHAVPTYMTAPDGRPTNAVFGFLNMLLKLLEDFQPAGVIVAFDQGIPEFRLAAIQQYKAQRPPTDPDLKSQFPIIRDLLVALEIPVVQVAGWEGDDILGTLAEQARQHAVECLLVTGDKDALQLVDDNTRVVNTRTGLSDVVIYDSAAVRDKWGIDPAQVPDFLGLMGDNSDNIPGVPGIGEKKARALLTEFGSLDQLLAAAAEIPGKVGESLRENADLARASREVATIRRDVPLDCPVAAIHFPSYSAAVATETFQEYALFSQLKRFLRLIEAAPDPKAPAQQDRMSPAMTVQRSSVSTVPDQSGLASAATAQQLPKSPDYFTSSAQANRPAAEASAFQPLLQAEAAWQGLAAALQQAEPVALLLDGATPSGTLFLLEEPHLWAATSQQVLDLGAISAAAPRWKTLRNWPSPLVVFDLKEFLNALQSWDINWPISETAAAPLVVVPSDCLDCRLASYLLDSLRVPETLTELLERYPAALQTSTRSSGEEPLDAQQNTSDQLPAALQVQALLSLARYLREELQSNGSWDCYQQIEQPLTAVLIAMERIGVRLDLAVLAEINQALSADLEELRQQAIQAAGGEFNLDSPKQLAAVLFEKLNLPALKKTRSGYSTDAAVLEELQPLHPLPGLMLEYRELAKLKSTYLDALPRLVDAQSHLHTSFNQMVTATGRLSSTEPNLQNIPVRRQIGRQIRQAFIPDAQALGTETAVLLSADYSQIELRLLAHLSGDAGLIQAFQSGADFHAMTAARVWNLAPEQVSAELRSRAKAVNFGIVYGQQAFGLSRSLGIGFAEAQSLIDRYFEAFPAVKTYLEQIVATAYTQGWVATMFGRRRYIRELKSSNPNTRHFGERTAMNHPMQGSAADIIKLAMLEVSRRIQAEDYPAQLILQVHDELVFNCALSAAADLSRLVQDVMENVVELQVPLLVSISQGANWAELH